MAPTKFGFGQSVRRKEDDPLLRGAGRYIADAMPAGALHAVVVRSTHAHARFKLDAAKAEAMPGVRLILTGDDINDVGLMPMQAGIPGVDIPVPRYPVLAQGEVRHVGDAVAFVVADTLEQAKDAAEAIDIQWEALPHVIGAVEALEQGAVQVWPDRPGNLAFEVALGNQAPTAKAMAGAPRTVSLTLVNQRLVTNYLDTRGVIAEYDAAADRLTLTLGSQGSHYLRDTLCEMLKLPPEKMRVVTPDVGGGFGTKLFIYREYALVALAARQLKKPVAWIADRSEHFLGDAQGRDNITTAKLALDDKGRFLALDIDLIADMGAYLSAYAPYIPFLGAGMSPGVYDIPHCHVRVRGVYTNTVPVDAYRGAGRPEAAYVIERLVDAAARELNVAPDALRRRNFIKPKAMPYTTATDKIYDTGDFASHMAHAQQLADWDGFKKRASASKKNGLLRGIGIATYIEACGNMGADTATIKLEQDGGVTALMGSQSSGQGHATAYAQIVADHLGLPPERVRMEQGDTDRIATGTGTGGSSSIPCGGASLDGATKMLAENLKRLAADALEASAGDLEIVEGAVRVAGTDRVIAFADLAKRPEATPDKLTASDAFDAAAADLPQRHTRRRGRDRRGDRPDPHCQLCGGRRFRRHAQSAAAGRTSAWRRSAGHRPGADGADGLRQGFRPARHRLADGLRAAARVGDAGLRIRDAQRALQGQSAGCEGRGRGRRNRLLPGGDERDSRCAVAGSPHPPCRYACHPGAAMGRHRGSAAYAPDVKSVVIAEV